MTINQIQTEDPPWAITKRTLLEGAIGFSAGLAFYCGLKLVDSAVLLIKENFFPDLLDIEERLDFERANLEWDLADLRSDCIGPYETTKTTFLLFCYLSKLIKLGNLTGITQTIKEQLAELKEDLINLFKKQPENPNGLRNIRILDEIEELTTRLESESEDEFYDCTTQLESERENPIESERENPIESERENPTADTIEITTAALDVINIITPSDAITNIVTTAKMLTELNKPLESNNTLNVSQKICKIAGHAGKVVSEFTPLPTIGRIFSSAVLMTGSVLGMVKQNAA